MRYYARHSSKTDLLSLETIADDGEILKTERLTVTGILSRLAEIETADHRAQIDGLDAIVAMQQAEQSAALAALHLMMTEV